jgi:hypothetical protein
LPLSKRARIEIYLPRRGRNDHARLQQAFESEFLNTFGGCTVIRNIKGLYLGSDGKTDNEPITLVYADTPFDFDEHFREIEIYTDELREATLAASDEESVLIVVHEIFHSLPAANEK